MIPLSDERIMAAEKEREKRNNATNCQSNKSKFQVFKKQVHETLTQESIIWYIVINACRVKEFVVPSTLTRCIMQCMRVLYFAPYRAHQANAIAIGISEANPPSH